MKRPKRKAFTVAERKKMRENEKQGKSNIALFLETQYFSDLRQNHMDGLKK